jgi:lipid-binding SYLF domain-containing protein
MKKTHTIRAAVLLFLGITICLVLYRPVPAHSASAREIDIRVDAALKKFYQKVSGGKEFLKHASGVLVFPKVIKAGIGIGGEYGEGALRINGKTLIITTRPAPPSDFS